jgi:hypothetical protein
MGCNDSLESPVETKEIWDHLSPIFSKLPWVLMEKNVGRTGELPMWGSDEGTVEI